MSLYTKTCQSNPANERVLITTLCTPSSLVLGICIRTDQTAGQRAQHSRLDFNIQHKLKTLSQGSYNINVPKPLSTTYGLFPKLTTGGILGQSLI